MLKVQVIIPLSISATYLVCAALVKSGEFGVLDATTAVLMYAAIHYLTRPRALIDAVCGLRILVDKNSEVGKEAATARIEIAKFVTEVQEMRVLRFPKISKILVKAWGVTYSWIDVSSAGIVIRYRWKGNLLDAYVTIILTYLCCSLKQRYPKLEEMPDILLSVQYVFAEKFFRYCGRPQHISHLRKTIIDPKTREDGTLAFHLASLRLLDRDGILPLYLNELARSEVVP